MSDSTGVGDESSDRDQGISLRLYIICISNAAAFVVKLPKNNRSVFRRWCASIWKQKGVC